jgi:hypothetical protein
VGPILALIAPSHLIGKIEGHTNKVTKCNNNQSKGENKAPKIINTGKYTINKHVSILYQEDPQRIISNKENSLTIMIIKSINTTFLFFKPINQDES